MIKLVICHGELFSEVINKICLIPNSNTKKNIQETISKLWLTKKKNQQKEVLYKTGSPDSEKKIVCNYIIFLIFTHVISQLPLELFHFFFTNTNLCC